MIALKMPNGSVAVAPDGDGSVIAARLGARAWRRVDALPDVPQERWEWTDRGALSISETPVEERRETASMTRAAFLNACVEGGIITQEVAEEAADGSWPSAFNTFISGLSDRKKIEAKATWADGKTVWRNNEILALIAVDQGVNDAQLDAMFGIVR